jgi:hypothetical protein
MGIYEFESQKMKLFVVAAVSTSNASSLLFPRIYSDFEIYYENVSGSYVAVMSEAVFLDVPSDFASFPLFLSSDSNKKEHISFALAALRGQLRTVQQVPLLAGL